MTKNNEEDEDMEDFGEDEELEETDIYDDYDELLNYDAITPGESGFMKGYKDDK